MECLIRKNIDQQILIKISKVKKLKIIINKKIIIMILA